MTTLNDLYIVSKSHLTNEPVAFFDRLMSDILQDTDSFGTLSSSPAVTAAQYHLDSGGHRIRAVLALHAGQCLGLLSKDSYTLATACELIHNASLIHDDLHDRDTQRRGQPSVWHQFGDEIAVCAGDLLLSASYFALSQLVDQARLPQLFALMHARIASAIRGQCAELYVPERKLWTIEDFKNIASSKSGALLSLPTELALLAAKQDMALARAREAAQAFSVAYQIHDDLIDLEADALRHSVDRSVCNIVLILRSDPNCVNAESKARQMALQQLLLACAACNELPLNAGGALHAMCLQLQDELECLE